MKFLENTITKHEKQYYQTKENMDQKTFTRIKRHVS